MALQKNIDLEGGFSAYYFRINDDILIHTKPVNIDGNQPPEGYFTAVGHFELYKNKTARQDGLRPVPGYNKRFSVHFYPGLLAANTIKKIVYNQAKQMPDFADAVDILEEGQSPVLA